MIEYFPDHRRVFDTGDDLNLTSAISQVSISKSNTRFKRLAQVIAMWRSGNQGDEPGNDQSAGQPICTTAGRPAGVRHMDVPDEIQRFEQDVRSAICVGGFELIAYLSIAGQ